MQYCRQRSNGIVTMFHRLTVSSSFIRNWWGQPPAILKGWVDRVIRPGVAYEFLKETRAKAFHAVCSKPITRSYLIPRIRRRSEKRPSSATHSKQYGRIAFSVSVAFRQFIEGCSILSLRVQKQRERDGCPKSRRPSTASSQKGSHNQQCSRQAGAAADCYIRWQIGRTTKKGR